MNTCMHSLQYVAGYLCSKIRIIRQLYLLANKILLHIMRNCSIQYWFDMSLDLPDQLDIQIRPHIQLS